MFVVKCKQMRTIFISKCRQFQDLSTGVFRLTSSIKFITRHSKPRHQHSHVLIVFAGSYWISLFGYT